MLCRICMDRSLDTALFPCGHAVACLDCARRCSRCPLCRADIDHCRTIYLPIELTHVEKENFKISSEIVGGPRLNGVKSQSVEIIGDRIETSENTVDNINNNNNNGNSNSSNINSNSNIWERRARRRFNAFQKIFRIFTCRIERIYWKLEERGDDMRATITLFHTSR